MQKETRVKFTALLGQIALINAIDSDELNKHFTVAPAPAQNLESAIQESSDFLKKINVLGVVEQEGESILIGVNGPIAGRTKTNDNTPRKPRDVSALTKDTYKCVQTNFDTAMYYAQLDVWAGFPDFQVRLSNQIALKQALDRIMIGFNGTSVAENTNLKTNPMLQDVNKGWLQKVRDSAKDRHMTGVTIGKGGTYQTLDGLVYDALQLLEPWYRNDPDLVVMIPRSMLHDKFLAAVEKGAQSNQEEVAADIIANKKRIAGLPWVDAPYFPDGTIFITKLSNLSIYYQNGKRRRLLREEPDYDRVADYQSSNEAYVIEDLGCVALVEGITAVSGDTTGGEG